ncbi:acyl-CoA dehydrogenase family protein [Streptacidiphilus sp. EB129]|uniref:acyl-CoA dehydrogenase family protein n=1 Tax=Streptacidiphilus sp. EB129 TaxID=3156262 RepID=UPI0035148312
MSFVESDEHRQLRASVAALAARYGHEYMTRTAKAGERTHELWAEAGKLGFLGVNLPEQYGGGGAGIQELAIVAEELATGGCPLLLIVVSPAICGTVIAKYGTQEQRQRWLPGIAAGTLTMAFAITEPDAGSNSHKLSTTARRDGGDWLLGGRKCFISGVDQADSVLVVARTEDAGTGRLRPALFVVPTDAPGFEFSPIEMAIPGPEKQFLCYFDDVRLPADALVGEGDTALAALFSGLNPERITVAAQTNGMARFALGKAAAYANEREVWGTPIGAHQGVAHPLAQAKINVELARLMTAKAAWLYDAGLDAEAGEAANMAKFAAGEYAQAAVDAAIQAHGGNGMTVEYGLGGLWSAVRVTRIAPVSREMILNYVAQHSLGLPKSY